MIKRPELLAPAGDRERFDSALAAGADAIYVGSTMFSMRAAPKNFDFTELAEICSLAHAKGVKIYLTLNTLPKNGEIPRLPDYIKATAEAGVDAFIAADIGVMSLCKKHAPEVDLHISTQAGVVNYLSANEFYNLGAKRIVTARELSLDEIAELRAKTPKELEIECFVHGAMCVSFSGRCLISNYLVGRDANRGECAQPCRWEYYLMQKDRQGSFFPVEQNQNGTYILNSKDMCMIEHIPDLVKAGVDSFKIEGRAKSAYYTAVITNAYRCAIDGYLKNPSEDYIPEQWIIDETRKVSYREYGTGFYYEAPIVNANVSYEGGYRREWDVMAVVEKCEGGYIYCEQRNKFSVVEELEALEFGVKPQTFTVKEIFDSDGNSIESTPHPMMKLKIRSDLNLKSGALLRRQSK
ncbi:MAG: U32 family peptidase [Ruminococcaceae bacterium]|nr:U32 family peptidase [Oscillospiraceae bacterium]